MNDHPVILTHGLFGWGPGECGGFPYWGTGVSVPSELARHVASVGPISSVHDRACELAFQIKGGRVHYGCEHAREAGHACTGRVFETGFHPGWSAERPVHLVGHSLGAPTIWMLQRLLAEDFFGWGSDETWVASITSISGMLNGSTACYFLGCRETDGRLAPESIGGFLARAVELFVRATGDLFDRVYDFDLDHWGLERQPDLRAYLHRIASSPMFRGTDNAAYDLTIQGAIERARICKTYPGTYYFSYATMATFEGFLTRHSYPTPTMNPLMIPTALYVGQAEYEQPFYPDFDARDWWPNDGLVSVFSQRFPRLAGTHQVGDVRESLWGFSRSLEPGMWHHQVLEGFDHIDIVALPQLRQVGLQKAFYTELFQLLASLDVRRARREA